MIRQLHCTALIVCAALLISDALTAHAADPYELKVPQGLKAPTVPADNPLTEAKIQLGMQLYFDPRLSRDNTVSCATCHDPQKGWSNGAAVATGIGGQQGGRSSPTIINAAFQMMQFWDGRAMHLEGQALGPIENPIEMNMKLDELVKKLSGIPGYRRQFAEVFGDDEIKPEYIAKAIAAFERTILSGNAPYDRFKAGDKTALTEPAQRGMKLFVGKAHCSACHTPPNFTDGGFHNIGLGVGRESADEGRFTISKLEGDKHSFKTPTLREIARTAPYMHDGSLATLEEVVDYYDKGGEKNPHLDEEIFPLTLSTQEKEDLVTFLKEGLSSPDYPLITPPKLPD